MFSRVARFSTCARRLGPKKKGKVVEEATVQLGRPSNNLKGGIVGLANVGKSTFFQALTASKLGNPANYPFATIDPEEAKVIVPSARFDKLCELYKPTGSTPATLTVFDIAGLTKGASKGDGLGNAFLSHIRSVDGLFQVVRAFEDPEIIHIEGNVDATRDLQIIFDELALKDMEFASKAIELAQRSMKRVPAAQQKAFKDELVTAEKVLAHLESGKRVIDGDWSNKEVEVINSMSLLTAKPSVYLANISEDDYLVGNTDTQQMRDIREWINENSPGDKVLPISIAMEARLIDLDPEERSVEMEILETKSALPEAIVELRKSLGLISYFTCGVKEVREWTIRKGTRAPEAAGVIHNDFQKTFVQAQVMKYDDVVEAAGDEAELKSKGKVQSKGKDYEVEDGDVILFKAGAQRK
ncbi:obg-like ATPase 1 [Trichomonascus vanleenenianus]|uniref:obg-like ATPase 1 n=1 Tax=Trichomonascus vanleenenianus TaxID=2268995 RepID=UPI003ECB79F4